MDKEQAKLELMDFLAQDLTKKSYLDILKYHRLYKNLRNELCEGKKVYRLAVLGSKSIQFLVSVIEMSALSKGIYLDIFEGEYDGITSEIMDDTSQLYAFKPEFVCILTHHSDIKYYPNLLCSDEEKEEWLKSQSDFYLALQEKLGSIGATVLQTLFVSPLERQLDQLEESLDYSKRNLITQLNIRLCKEKPSYVHYIDANYIAECVGKLNWFDERNYYLNKAAFNYDYLPLLADHFTSRLESLTGKSRKCVVLDLDNTLWGGIVGDVGYEGINLNPNDAVGESYLAFQEYLLGLKQRGIILAICSKNEEDVAKEAFEKNPYIKIKLSDIACFKANWNDKASNIKDIAAELNIGTDSLVFVDDNPAERRIVKKFLPEVTVIELSEDPAYYVRDLSLAMKFDWAAITKEDISRVETYIDNAKRNALMHQFVDYSEYLKSLDMTGSAHEISEEELGRFVQLCNKSNQFNLRTVRLTEAEGMQLIERKDAAAIGVTLKDCFSDYGIISCIILEKQGEDCFITNWLMSCRVLKRGVEDFALNKVVSIAKQLGCKKLIGEYIPSPKNKMVENFYKEMGFDELDDGKYSLNVEAFNEKIVYIEEE